mmetsp:Transcript_45420/g.71053  ORF Transcript_45420/g.71053 Transcript_45420/m.71053 type:complete len:480 (+) Transcript_45420:140-1579(+)
MASNGDSQQGHGSLQMEGGQAMQPMMQPMSGQMGGPQMMQPMMQQPMMQPVQMMGGGPPMMPMQGGGPMMQQPMQQMVQVVTIPEGMVIGTPQGPMLMTSAGLEPFSGGQNMQGGRGDDGRFKSRPFKRQSKGQSQGGKKKTKKSDGDDKAEGTQEDQGQDNQGLSAAALLPSGEPDPRVASWPAFAPGKTAKAALYEFCAKRKVRTKITFRAENSSAGQHKVTVNLAGMDWGWGASASKNTAEHLAANETLKMLVPTYDGTGCLVPGCEKTPPGAAPAATATEGQAAAGPGPDIVEDTPEGVKGFNYGPESGIAKWSMCLNMFGQFQKLMPAEFEISTIKDAEGKSVGQCTGSWSYCDASGQEHKVTGTAQAKNKKTAQHKLAARFLAQALPECTSYLDAFPRIEEMKNIKKAQRAKQLAQKRRDIQDAKLKELEQQAFAAAAAAAPGAAAALPEPAVRSPAAVTTVSGSYREHYPAV